MNTHRNARIATILACVALACLTDHFVCDRIRTPLGVVVLILYNIVMFGVAIWHFKKVWWFTSLIIASLIMVPVNTQADAEPQAILCIVVGGAIVIGGIYAAYKVYKCAKTNLSPCTPPPTNAPPSKPGEWDIAPSKGKFFKIQTVSLPAMELAIDDSVTTSNWVDWQGNHIAYAFGGTITNLMLNGTNYAYHRSEDLKTWIPMTMTVTGWVSQVNGMDSNQVFITYYDGQPCTTNWAKVDSTGTNAISLGSVGGFAIDKTKQREFFKLARIAASAQ